MKHFGTIEELFFGTDELTAAIANAAVSSGKRFAVVAEDRTISFHENNPVKENYENGRCPDCNKEIPDLVKDEESCKNCGHVFYLETK